MYLWSPWWSGDSRCGVLSRASGAPRPAHGSRSSRPESRTECCTGTWRTRRAGCWEASRWSGRTDWRCPCSRSFASGCSQEEAEQLEGLQADGFVVTVEELHDGANALFVVECRYHAWWMLVHQCHYQLQHVDQIFVLLMERPRIRNVNKEQELENDIFQCCFL